MATAVEINGQKHYPRFSFKALKSFTAETGVTMDRMDRIGKDIELMEAFVYHLLKAGDAYHGQKELTREEVEDANIKVIGEIMEAVAPEMEALFGKDEKQAKGK